MVNWSWYMQVDDALDESLPMMERSPLLQRFCEQNNCTIRYIEFDEEQKIEQYMRQNIGEVDLAVLTPNTVGSLAAEGLLQPFSDSPERQDIRPEIRQIFGDTFEYFKSVLLGYVGILSNTQQYPQGCLSWADFLSVDDKKPIGFLNDEEESMASFFMHLGIDVNTNDRGDIKKAGLMLRDLLQKKKIGFIGSDLETLAGKNIKRGTFGGNHVFRRCI